MSSSAPQQRSRGPKGSSRPQSRYFPKSNIGTYAVVGSASTSDQSASNEKQLIPPLTTSLRSHAATKPPKVDKGKESGGGGCFVRYLPQEEAVASGLGADAGGLDAVESQAVIDFLNEELSRLLKTNPRDFWREGELLAPC
ncbi:hypothetical protein HPP92_009536 [Vanilla planifolia]|uniref:Uncharacterized protein n=1 Tax=Vanilla planifolia TaxID=51239 RepID=A0A835RGD7_VANPL|nr:hypothetical protein HPP92_009536 [Vanilla planifolia]